MFIGRKMKTQARSRLALKKLTKNMGFVKIHGHQPVDVDFVIGELHQHHVGLDLQQLGGQLRPDNTTVQVDQSCPRRVDMI